MNRPRAVDFLDPEEEEKNSFEGEKEFLDEAPIVVSESESESEKEKIEDSELQIKIDVDEVSLILRKYGFSQKEITDIIMSKLKEGMSKSE